MLLMKLTPGWCWCEHCLPRRFVNLGLERSEDKVMRVVKVRPLVDPVAPVHHAVTDAFSEGDLVVGILLATVSFESEKNVG